MTSSDSGLGPEIASHQGWSASLSLGFEFRRGGTSLVRRSHRGPMAVQRPFYPGDGACHLYLLHPPGGIAGGDRLSVEVDAGSGSAALITTPGAGKLYRSAGMQSRLEQVVRVAEGASLEWLPQECIVFPGALATVSTSIHLQGSARVAAWEIQCLGLPVLEKRFDTGCVEFRLEVWRNGAPLLLERLSPTPEILKGPGSLRGQPVVGTLVMMPATEEARERVRRTVAGDEADFWGVTLVDGLLVVRYLGGSAARARRLFLAVWAALRPTIIGRPPCEPRIWAT